LANATFSPRPQTFLVSVRMLTGYHALDWAALRFYTTD